MYKNDGCASTSIQKRRHNWKNRASEVANARKSRLCLHEKSPNRKNSAYDKVECREIAVGTVSEVRLGQYIRKMAVFAG